MFTFETEGSPAFPHRAIQRPNGDDQVGRHDRHRHRPFGAGKYVERSAALDHHAGSRPAEGPAGRAAARTALQQLR